MLNDQERLELRGMLVHFLRLTPAAAMERVRAIETKNAAGATQLLGTVREVENGLRASIEREIDLVMNPPAPTEP